MRSFAILLTLCVLVGTAMAQGSAAGAGFGGGGGRAGGYGGGLGGAGGGRFADSAEPFLHPEDDTNDGRLYETRTAILTPGDRVEYKLTVEKSATLFAGATSDAFDPALSIEDASGHVLAKNDDRAEGDQAPFVAFRFPAAGSYTLKVLSYKQAAGGKFTLKMRTFVASDATIGTSVHEFPAGVSAEHRVDLRIAAKKGIVYDLSALRPAGPPGGVPSFVRVIGPSGVETSDFDRIATADGAPVFQAKVDGDFYVEYRAYGPVRFESQFREVPLMRGQPVGEVTAELAPFALVLIEFPIEARQIVRTALDGGPFAYRMTAPDAKGFPESGYQTDTTYGNTPSWAFFQLERDSDRDVVRIFRTAGVARLAIRSTSRESGRVTVRSSTTIPTWVSGRSEKGTLKIGEIRLLLLPSENAELMRVAATSPTFQPRLDIFRLDGTLANFLMDRNKHTAADDLYFPKSDTFLVRLSCDGYGGSGEFDLRRDVPKPLPYPLGSLGNLTFDGANFGLYAVNLEAGKRYELITDDPHEGLRTDLIDDEGGFLYGQVVPFGRVRVQYFQPTKTGSYRLWLRGAPGTVKFRLSPYAPPILGASAPSKPD